MTNKGDLISRDALKEDFKSRLALCNEWIAKAKDKETKIRASAVKAFIAEVIMTINNAPSVETYTPEQVKELVDLNKKLSEERPQNHWIKIFENPYTNGYVCSVCGHEIHVSENFLPKVTECEACGSEMKGGAE